MSGIGSTVKSLGVFSIVMITIGSVDSIRNLPTTALFGSSLIFFFFLGALLFLLPAALVSAELASSTTETGGVYAWVKAAFGTSMGFLAVWFQWVENVIWYPTILSFVAGTIGYLISPTMATDKYFLITVILASFWGTTLVNWFGIKTSARFSSFCAIAGLLLPMALIIGLGAAWIFLGHPMQIHFGWHAMLPSMHDSHIWVALTGVMLSFCGIEIATVHAGDVNNPQRTYPRAMLYATIIILVTLVLGSLAIAIVIPSQQISLVAGLMQAYHAFFGAYHLNWILPAVALTLVIGAMGEVNNWVIAPTRGLLIASLDGNLPKVCAKENSFGSPVLLLLVQAVIVTLVALVFLLLPSVNGSYWLLTALAAQLYMLMYIIMFIAAIRLRYKKVSTHVAGYRIPFGNVGMWVTGLVGLLASVVTLIIGFIPPSNIKIGGVLHYEVLLISGLFLMSLPPFLFSIFCKPRH